MIIILQERLSATIITSKHENICMLQREMPQNFIVANIIFYKRESIYNNNNGQARKYLHVTARNEPQNFYRREYYFLQENLSATTITDKHENICMLQREKSHKNFIARDYYFLQERIYLQQK